MNAMEKPGLLRLSCDVARPDGLMQFAEEAVVPAGEDFLCPGGKPVGRGATPTKNLGLRGFTAGRRPGMQRPLGFPHWWFSCAWMDRIVHGRHLHGVFQLFSVGAFFSSDID